MGPWPECMPMYHCLPCARGRVTDPPTHTHTVIPDGGEPPCRCWELNPGRQKEQLVLLSTEQYVQPSLKTFERIVL